MTPKAQAEAFLRDNLDEAIRMYRERETYGGVLNISSDAARELLPGYGTPLERTANNFLLGSTSSALAEAVWEKALASGPDNDRYIVTFLTGSPGSGKTSSVLGGDAQSHIAIIREGMMDDLGQSVLRVQQAMDAGFVTTLRLVYVDDPRTTVRRAVARAMTCGRPLRIAQMARLYVEIPQTIAGLAESFGTSLGIVVFDNSIEMLEPRPVNLKQALDATRAYTVPAAKENMYDELDRLYRAGKVSHELYASFRGDH